MSEGMEEEVLAPVVQSLDPALALGRRRRSELINLGTIAHVDVKSSWIALGPTLLV